MELGRRLWRKSQQDEVMGRAAQLAYYALLALFPALIFLTALMGLFSVQRFMPELMSYLRNVLPADALSMVERFLTQVAEGSGANILSLGALPALWASSSGVTAMMDALNVVFDVKEDRRPFWRVRLIAILPDDRPGGFRDHVFGAGALWTNDRAVDCGSMGFGIAFTGLWNVLQWPIIAGLMPWSSRPFTTSAPTPVQAWRLITPGACSRWSCGWSCRSDSKPMWTISAITTKCMAQLPASSS